MISLWIRTYGKAGVAVLFAALTAAYVALSADGRLDPDEWVVIAIAATNASGVYLVPLAPQYRWAKTGVAALLAALQVAATVILGGVTPDEWLLILLAVGQVIGVGAAPAESNNGISARRPDWHETNHPFGDGRRYR